MDSAKKRTPDYTDIAYRDAVARLRYLLAESYAPSSSKYAQAHAKRDESDNETEASFAASDRSRHGHTHTHMHTHYRPAACSARRALLTDSLPKLTPAYGSASVPPGDCAPKAEGPGQPPAELMAFIERQEEYIEQLEKESQYCRDELSHLLGKVKDVISENDGLRAKEKAGLLKSVFDSYETGDDDEENEVDTDEKEKKKQPELKKKPLEGPSIVFESRISELEAQLTQTKLDLKKAQEEADMYRKKLSEQPFASDTSFLPVPNSLRQQLDNLQREKEELSETVSKLQSTLAQYREKEAEAAHKAKKSLDIVDQAQFEKTQAELEARRLKEELDRQHDRLCELLQEQARKVQEERAQAERRYAHQVEQLSTELAAQWDNASRLQLELEKQRRTEQELRRELQQKAAIVDELKKELSAKTSGLQSEVIQAAAERGSVEQELAASRLAAERVERDARQEASRLQAEVAALRQRLDRADADLLHSRRENLRLAEQIASLERELNLARMMRESSEKTAESPAKQKSGARDKDLSSVIMDMDAKHVQTVAELESMIQSQNQVMEKLKDECHLLTQKLEEASLRHKEERMGLKQENAGLTRRLEQLWENCKDVLNSHEQETPTVGIQAASMSEQTTSHNMKQSTHNLNITMTPTTDPSTRLTQQHNTNTQVSSLITISSPRTTKRNPSTTNSNPRTTYSNPRTPISSPCTTKRNPSTTISNPSTTKRNPSTRVPGSTLSHSSTNLQANCSTLPAPTPPSDLRPSGSSNRWPSSRTTRLNTHSTGSSSPKESSRPDRDVSLPSLDRPVDGRSSPPSSEPCVQRPPSSPGESDSRSSPRRSPHDRDRSRAQPRPASPLRRPAPHPDSSEPPVHGHPCLLAWRPHAVAVTPLSLEDLATDSESRDSQSAQLFVFR
ncbi:serologically defined colon cancer antigen 8 homolog isoform X2 [Bacillus rossius redtenbacheri]